MYFKLAIEHMGDYGNSYEKNGNLACMRKIGFCFILCFFVWHNGFSQFFLEKMAKEGIEDYEKFMEEVEEYYKDKDKGRGSGYKQFKRWEYFHLQRIGSDNSIKNLTRKSWDEYYKAERLRAARSSSSTSSVPEANWRARGPADFIRFGAGRNGGLGRINDVYVDPDNSDIIYACSPGGGLWRSEVGGSSWSPLTDGMPHTGASGVVVDPSSPVTNRTIYLLTGDGDGSSTRSIGVLKSLDNGVTWHSTGLFWSVTSAVRAYKIIMHPTDYQVLFVVSNVGIFKTEDGGLTWENKLSAYTVDIEFKPDNSAIMYASGRLGGFYKSTDSGNSWTEIAGGLPDHHARIALAVTPLNPEYVYLLYGGVPEAGRFLGLYRSEDAGNTFIIQSDTPNILGGHPFGTDRRSQGWYDLTVEVSPLSAEEIYVGGINTWKSSDGGVTWMNTSYWVQSNVPDGNYTHADIHDLQFFGNTLYCGSDGGVYISTNFADDWTSISTGLEITEIYRIGVYKNDGNIALVGTQDNGSNRWENNEKVYYHWLGGDGFETIAHPFNPQVIYGCVQFGNLYKTVNNGLNISFIKPSSEGGNWLTPYVMSPQDPETLVAGYTNVWKTTDGGSSWENISNDSLGDKRANHVAIAPSNPDVIYVSKQNRLYKTSDGGNNWTNLTANLGVGLFITYMAIKPTDADVIWVTLSFYSAGNKVYKSTDGGITWSNISGSLPNLPANCIVYQNDSPDRVYVGMDVGVYYLDNEITDWVPFNTGLPNVEVSELEISYSDGTLQAGTYGRGLWETDIDVTIVVDTTCIEQLVLTAAEDSTKTYKARTITSSSRLLSNADITYLAKSKVRFETGFYAHVEDNARMYARLSENVCESPTPVAFRTPIASTPVTGTYAGPMPGLIQFSSLEGDPVSVQPEQAVLIAYPNPFTNQTTINFKIYKNQMINLALYDVNGKLVKSIIHNENYIKGAYRSVIDGSELRPGIYYCILRGTLFKKTIKLAVH